MGKERRLDRHWDDYGVAATVKNALAMDLPRGVMLKVERMQLADEFAFMWHIGVVIPHMEKPALIEIKQPNLTPFPYEEVLTKIRLFLP